jgi:hypothetical protein
MGFCHYFGALREGCGAAAVRIRQRRTCLYAGDGRENSRLTFYILAEEMEPVV